MNSYRMLAGCYDRLTNDVDYDAMVAFYRTIWEREGMRPRTAADLACGTGSVAVRLAEMGMDVTGVDMSEDMLCMAYMKSREAGLDVRLIHQRLQDLHLLRGVDLAVCALDSMDYITDPGECRMAIRRIYQSLNPFGCLIFDVNTPEKLRNMDGQVFLDEDEDVYCVWRGDFDEDSNICTYAMDLFVRNGSIWRRSLEEHREYAYSAQQLTGYLKEAGFTHIEVFGDRRLEAPDESDQRIYLKARKGVRK